MIVVAVTSSEEWAVPESRWEYGVPSGTLESYWGFWRTPSYPVSCKLLKFAGILTALLCTLTQIEDAQPVPRQARWP